VGLIKTPGFRGHREPLSIADSYKSDVFRRILKEFYKRDVRKKSSASIGAEGMAQVRYSALWVHTGRCSALLVFWPGAL
jgi:hypothetical protein